ncbi:DUF4455-containing protein [Aureococcus anophagefferens]|nr:DUF4455-containing protein [Aureococcus anophagefferens]
MPIKKKEKVRVIATNYPVDGDDVSDMSDEEEDLSSDPHFEGGAEVECELVGLKSVLFVQTMWSPTLLASLGERSRSTASRQCVLETDDLGVARVRAVAKKKATVRTPLTKLELAALCYDLKEALAEFNPTPLPLGSIEEELHSLGVVSTDPRAATSVEALAARASAPTFAARSSAPNLSPSAPQRVVV